MRKTKKLTEIHSLAIKRFDKIQEDQKDERDQALQDRRFYSIAGAQWEGSLGEEFENKPKFEINKIHLSVMRIITEARNNEVSVDFISKDGTQSDGMADVCDSLFRADEKDSSASEAYDNSFEEAVGGGFGAFRLCSEYEDEEDEENEKQRIKIEPIYDADSCVYFDPDSKKQDKSDAKYCFVIYSMSKEGFEEEYDKDPDSVSKVVSNSEYDWNTPDAVHIAEYYVMEKEKKDVYVYTNITGTEERYTDEDFEENEQLEEQLAAVGTQRTRTKKLVKRQIHKYILSGSEILEDCGPLAGKNIPIIPVYGKRWFIDGTERFMGHVRLAKDVQRLKNMLMSKLAEISSISSISKPIFTAEQMAGHEELWAEDNLKNNPFLLVNPITGIDGSENPLGPIGYTKSPEIPQALSALMQIADVDIKELLGSHAEADKIVSHVSGKAQELVAKRIDGQAFIYMSNFSKAIQRAGEVWLSMAKDVYVEKGRHMKTVDSAGETGSVELRVSGVSKDGAVIERNDLTAATFDVAVDVGPSSSSQRASTVQTITGMLATTTDPETAQVLQSVAFMNMEGDGISDIRDYFRSKLVKMGVVKPTEEESEQMAAEAENAEPSANDKALEAMAAESLAKAENQKAEVFKTNAETEKLKAETLNTLDEINLNKLREAKAYIEQVAKLKQQQQAEQQAKMEQVAEQQVPQGQGQGLQKGQGQGPMGNPQQGM